MRLCVYVSCAGDSLQPVLGLLRFSAAVGESEIPADSSNTVQVIDPASDSSDEAALERRFEDELCDTIVSSALIHRGDVLRLKVGDVVPADGVLLLGSHIGLDESMMTVTHRSTCCCYRYC